MERASPIEFRAGADGRITGPALVYGDLATIEGGRKERFEPGAFQDVPGEIRLNLQHDPEIEVGTAKLTDGAQSLDAAASVKQGFRDLVKRRSLTAFSIEFRAIEEAIVDGVRVIKRAALLGLALVDTGAYPASRVEARKGDKAGKSPDWTVL